jgi:hypothetical protein
MSSQSIAIYLGSGETRERRIENLDKLARHYVPDSFISREGSERSVLFQLLADNPDAAGAALEMFLNLIGHGTGDPPPGIVLWNGRQWEIKATPLDPA